MSEFKINESYLHKFAKNLLARQLREEEKGKDFCEYGPFKWRKNYGVFTELTFYKSSTPYYFETSEGLKLHEGFTNDNKDKRGENPLNWFHPNYNRGEILFVPDIVIFHKGTPTIIIEVVHTHHLSQKKINDIEQFFSGNHIEIYEVSATELLNCTDKLDKVNFIKVN